MTPRQRDLFAFIVAFQRDNGGVSPSLDEMTEALHLGSKSGVHRLLIGLEEQGMIRRQANRARRIEVLRQLPAAGAPTRAAPLADMVAVPIYPLQAMPATGRYPFLSHRTCAEWLFSLHGKAA